MAEKLPLAAEASSLPPAIPVTPSLPPAIQAAPVTPPARPAPVTYPRPLRRGDQDCVQDLDRAGQLVETCQAAANVQAVSPEATSERHPLPAETPKPSKAVGSIAVLGAVQIATAQSGGSAFLPAFSLFGELGGRLTPAIALVGMLNTNFSFGPGGSVQAFIAAPGVRLGEQSHVSVGAGLAYLAAQTQSGSGGGLLASILAEGVLVIWGPLNAQANASMSFTTTGTVFQFGAGLGVTLF